MRLNDYCGRGKGYLKIKDFKGFVDAHDYIKEIELSNDGEIFLNPELIEIIKYAYERDVILTANTGVNFNTVSDEIMEGMVKYGFRSLSVAADGVRQEIYSFYRRGGNINAVFSNIKRLVEYKKKHNSQYPRIRWQFVLMNHNQNDVQKAKEVAQELNIQLSFKLGWDDDFEAKDPILVKELTGLEYLSRRDYERGTGHKYLSEMCNTIWTKPTINFDGTLVGCECEPKKDYKVNVFEIGLEEAMNCKEYVYSQKMLLGEEPVDYDNPCAACPQGHYKWRAEHGDFVKIEELSPTCFTIDEKIFKMIEKDARVAIFGAHDMALDLKYEFDKQRHDIEVVCFLDRFRPGKLDGLPVYSPFSIDRYNSVDVIVLSSGTHQSAMRDTLVSLGIGNDRIIDATILQS